MTRVVGVQGTWGRGGGWWQCGSALWLYLYACGLEPALMHGRPFEWDTELNQLSWQYGGKALRYFLQALPDEDRNVVAFSHGGQLPFWACAEGAHIRRLITIGTPVRDDLQAIRGLARRQIDRWWHVQDEDADSMAVIGAIDGIVGPIERRMPEADVNVGVIGIGHGGLLSNPLLFPQWQHQSLAAFLRGEGYERAA